MAQQQESHQAIIAAEATMAESSRSGGSAGMGVSPTEIVREALACDDFGWYDNAGHRRLWISTEPVGLRVDAGNMEVSITRSGVVVPVPVDPLGVTGPTPGQARGPRWRRAAPNQFVPARIDGDREAQRIVEAVAGAGEGAAVTGWAALCWQHARWFNGRTATGVLLPVPLAVGDRGHLAPRRGVRFCYDWLFDDDIIRCDGLPITHPLRSVCVEALRARTLEDTVRVIDMAAASDLVSLDELRRYAARIKGRPHTRRLSAALDLAEENAWSPTEVTMRLRWLARRPVTLLCNPAIFDQRGRHLSTPDLLDPAARVIGEYNGAVHDGLALRRRDLAREELYRSLGFEVVVMMSTDLKDRLSFERRLDAAYRRAGVPELQRAWTLDRPPWWIDTSTVARRRALDEVDRQHWLRHGVG
ncbi:MAG: hypothetical protein L0H31_05885 [Nocardioidaceae bacterium]|nr:hypothetical protein [Nocardioidaceae bacterium]